MNTLMIFITTYAAYRLAEDIMKLVFKWAEQLRKEEIRKRNSEISSDEAESFYWLYLEDELSWLGFNESAFSKKYDSMTFIGHDYSIRIGTNGMVYGCETSEEFAEITRIVSIVKEITELWRKSVPMSDDTPFGERILLRVGNMAFAARKSCFSRAEFSLWQFDGAAYKKHEDLGADYLFAKEVFALNLLLVNLSLMQMSEEKETSQKWNTIDGLLNLAKLKKGLIDAI